MSLNINFKDKYNNIVSSVVTTVITKTTTNPLERIKILQQTGMHFNIQYYNTIKCTIQTIGREEYIYGFFKGNLTNILRIIPAQILRFELNGVYNNIFVKSKEKPTYLNYLTSGVAMGVTQNIITYPIDVVRSLRTLDNNSMRNNSILNCISHIYKSNGIGGYYKGLSISVSIGSMYIGTQFSLYNYLKDNYTQNTFVAGSISGFIAQTLWYYGDTLKRNMHVNMVESKYKNIFDCIKKIGIKNLYSGYRINVIKSIIETPLQFYIYENIREIMEKNDYNYCFSI